MSLPRAEEWTDPGSMDVVRSRGRTFLLVAAVGLIALVGGLFIWRATTLIGLPDIGEPFDVKARGTVDIPDAENAFTYYRAALDKLTERPMSSRSRPYVNWAEVGSQDREWYLANLEPLRIWLAGTTMDRALLIQPKDQTCEGNALDVVQHLRAILPLVQIAGLQMEARGDLLDAWIFYRAGLRCSRHCGMHGGNIERLIGMTLYWNLSNYVMAWSDHPNLSIENLRDALNDLKAIDAMTPSLRETYEAEYFAFANLLDQPGITTWKVDAAMKGTTRDTLPTLRERASETFWQIIRREPERSRRALRLLWANRLAVIDLTESDRASRRRDYPLENLFVPPPDAPASARALTPESLNRWIESTRLLRRTLPLWKAFDPLLAREQAIRGSVLVHVAERLYRREHGEPPESVEALVGPYLDAIPEGYVPLTPRP